MVLGRPRLVEALCALTLLGLQAVEARPHSRAGDPLPGVIAEVSMQFSG